MKMSEQAAERILEDIARGDLRAGEELPSEATLAETYGVSRLTVREAVSSLANRGVVDVRHGKRSVVAPVERWSVLDPQVLTVRGRMADNSEALVGELMEARLVLEVALSRFAAERATEDQLDQLRAHLQTMQDTVDDDGPQASARADLEFHRCIAEAAGNAFLAGSYEPLEKVLMAVRMQTSSSRAVREDAIMWHQRILEALETRDPDAAAAAMEGHMGQTMAATQGLRLV
jgi:DNA-binding FadR family transcriptional regulator